MAELKRIDEEMSTAELASYGIPAKQPDRPKLVKSQEPETLDRGTAVSEPLPLFSEPRQASRCRDAATRGRFRQRAGPAWKAVGQR
jgi:hypothetical protein